MWAAIFAMVPQLVLALTEYNILVHLPSNYDKLVIMLLDVAVLAGIINNPDTENPGLNDD